MAHGVRFEMPESVIIDHDVDIGMESVIGAHVHLKNGTLVGNHCVIDAFSYLSNALLADSTFFYFNEIANRYVFMKNNAIS